ncbi:phage tail protein [Pantoea agglomerans]|uniref:phage tail protein n=1 Tax=Enterobacter agglomerans TaxID=549 RepID=UPI0013C906E1|nr:phage tail protein [Pantoea agglomerans]MBD8198199.1 phage tail protein [Pantoea agglomerans]NEG82928.1 phage tail protein [Pantoea agglomerans]
MTTKYFALLTNQGAAKLANAAALGTKVNITSMGVGDGGGTLPAPDAAQTKLISEKRRAQLNSLTVDAANSSQIIAEQIIPESEGGFWIREIGLYDADGVLIAVANCPETYKPQLAEGSGRTQTVRMILIVNSTTAVTLKIDPSVVLATRQYVDNAIIEVKAYADDLMAKHIAAADPHKQYAPKESPVFTGTPKAPTPAAGNSSTLLATTAFVQAAIAQLVASSPEALDTLNELAAALGNDPNFSATMMNQLAARALLAGNVNQQFSVKDATADGHAVNRGQVNTLLAQKAALNGNANQDFQVRNSGETNSAVSNARLGFMLGGYAFKGGDAGQGFAVAGGNSANSAVAYGQFQAGTNGNGAWIKLPNGAQWCRQNLSIPAKTNVIWTYPAAFTAPPAVFITGINGDPAVWSTGVGAGNAGIYNNNDSALNVNLLAIW